jgi:radical SAM-linked protein
MVDFVKIRVKFEKGEPVKFISHLDIMRTFERAMRRAKLPLAFSRGFTPHPRMVFASALPVGITSSGEYFDAEFYENIAPDEVGCRLNSALPEGIKIKKVGFADGKFPLSAINRALYKVIVSSGVTAADWESAVTSLLSQTNIIVDKVLKDKTKRVNIAPLIDDISIVNVSKGKVELRMELSTGQGGSVQPQVIVTELSRILSKELSLDLVHRLDLFLKKGQIRISPL